MPIANDSIYATVANGIIYVIGGFAPGNGRLANVLAYNPTSNSWNTLAPLKIGKSNSALGAIGSMIISAGGLATSGVTTDNEGYNVATNSWATLTPMPAARNAGCFAAMGSTLYVAGGNPVGNTGPQLNTMDAYDANLNTWTTGLPVMPHAIVGAGSASVGGRLYCFGGSNQGDPLQGTIFNYVQIYQPNPTISNIISASGFGGFAAIAPGTWAEIYGANLAIATRNWEGSDLNGVNAPTSLDGTSVTIGGQAAFISFISPGQINAQVPSNVGTGMRQVIVTRDGVSTPFNITVSAVQPGLLASSPFDISGTQYAVALFADGTYVLPTSAIAGVASRPAKPGDTIALYGVGFGPVTPNTPAGQIVQQINALASTLQMSVGGMPAMVAYSGLVPNFIGLYQINIVVPSVGNGAMPLTFSLGGTAGTQTLYIAVQN